MFTIVFGALSFVALSLTMATHDWRLKTVAVACLAVWLTTFVLAGPGLSSPQWLDPVYTAFVFATAFCIQARGEVERARGEPLAMWLLVPMGVEAVIAVSYLAEALFLTSKGQFVIVQLGFGIELICLIVVAGRRLELAGRVDRAHRSFAMLMRASVGSA